MEELTKTIESFDDEKKKKLFLELCNVETLEGIMDISNNYDLKISQEVAKKLYEGFKNTKKLTEEDLARTVAGCGMPNMFLPWGVCYPGTIFDW